jgi:RND family efflux transporter MFP subunit
VNAEPSPPATGRSHLVKGSLQIVLIVLVLVLGVAANFLLSRSGPQPSSTAGGAPALLVDVLEPATTSAPVQILESGVVHSRNTVGLTPPVSGRVVEVSPNLASGGEFEAGEILFRLDPSDYQTSVDQARADVSSARAILQVEEAEAAIARREWDLVHPGETIPALVAREPQIAQAEAAIEAAEARLRAAELNLERVAFSLPSPGRIVQTTVELGQRLVANQTYGQAYALDSLEIAVPLDAEILEALEPVVGRAAIVRRTGRRQTQSFPAVVSRVEAELDQATRLGQVIVRFTGATSIIPGTFVDVEIIGPTVNDALVIPEAVMAEARFVWVVENGRLQKRAIELLGMTSEGSLIVSSFDWGEGIVVSPLVSPAPSLPARIVSRETLP